MSASSLGAASTLPLPETSTVSRFASTSPSRALPEPETAMLRLSTAPWAVMLPLPLMAT